MEQFRSVLNGLIVLLLGAAAACTAPPLEEQPKEEFPPPVEVPDTNSPKGGREGITDPPISFCDPSDIAGALPLSQRQYAQTIKAVLGESVAKFIEPMPSTGWRGFDTDSLCLASGSFAVEVAARNATTIAKQLVAPSGSATGVLPCDMRTNQNASDCAARTIEILGPLLLRRALQDQERTTLLALFERTRSKDGAVSGLENVLRTLLLSPSFLFQIERGEDPVAGTNTRFLAPHELAHRLAFVLWGTPADAVLLDKARSGELSTAAGIRSNVDAMLKDPRSHFGIQDFYAQWLGFNQVLTRSKDEKTFPLWNVDVAAEALAESMQFVDDNFFVEGGKLEHLFNNRSAVVGPKLAEFYGVRGGPGKLELPVNERSGILTRVAFLAGGSGTWGNQPTFRGATMINSLLCEDLPLPSASTEGIFPNPATEPQTTRQLIEMSVVQSQCAGCHNLIDPFGFTFENYDATGVYRTTEKGLPIDASGKVDLAVDGGRLTGDWKNAIEFSAWLATQDKLKNCVASQFWRHSASHVADGNKDSCAVERLTKVLDRKGAGVRELVIETLADEDFRKVAAGVAPSAAGSTTRGLPESKTAQETVFLIAARSFEDAAVGMPSEPEIKLKQWSQAFLELARRVAATPP